MKRLALLILLGWSRTGYAWNSTGHKAIALIAYERLTPVTKQRVDQLLARHPDYPKWIAGITTADRGRAAFLAASVWPDTIRSDPRFPLRSDARRKGQDCARAARVAAHRGSGQ